MGTGNGVSLAEAIAAKAMKVGAMPGHALPIAAPQAYGYDRDPIETSRSLIARIAYNAWDIRSVGVTADFALPAVQTIQVSGKAVMIQALERSKTLDRQLFPQRSRINAPVILFGSQLDYAGVWDIRFNKQGDRNAIQFDTRDMRVQAANSTNTDFTYYSKGTPTLFLNGWHFDEISLQDIRGRDENGTALECMVRVITFEEPLGLGTNPMAAMAAALGRAAPTGGGGGGGHGGGSPVGGVGLGGGQGGGEVASDR